MCDWGHSNKKRSVGGHIFLWQDMGTQLELEYSGVMEEWKNGMMDEK
jgi:hypothetical protein